MEVDGNGHLIAIFNDGTTADKGYVIGATGPTGPQGPTGPTGAAGDGSGGIAGGDAAAASETILVKFLSVSENQNLNWKGDFSLFAVMDTPGEIAVEYETQAFPIGLTGVRLNGKGGNPLLKLARSQNYTFTAENLPDFVFVNNQGITYSNGIVGDYPLAAGQFTFAVPANAPSILFYQCAGATGTVRIMNNFDYTIYEENDLVRNTGRDDGTYVAIATTFGMYPDQENSGFESFGSNMEGATF